MYKVMITAIDASGTFAGSRVTGAIFDPPLSSPPPSGAKPLDIGTPSTSGPLTVTFPSPAVPPSTTCTMLLTETGPAGDVLRSGPMLPMPPSPANLALWIAPTQSWTAADLSSEIAKEIPMTFPISQDIADAVALSTGGVVTPQSLTVTDVSMQLGTPTTVTVNGSLNAKYVGFITESSGFSLTGSFTFAPSGDATVPSRIVSVTSNSPAFSLDAFFLNPPAALALAAFGSEAIASKVEGYLNQFILTVASGFATKKNMQVSPTAVLVIESLTVTSDQLSVAVGIADLFGPGIQPVPPPLQNLTVSVSPAWQCNKAETYVLTVENASTHAPVAGASVSLTTPEPGDSGNQPVITGVTGATGTVRFTNATLRSWVYVHPPLKPGMNPVVETFQPVLNVTAGGFNRLTNQLSCPASAQ